VDERKLVTFAKEVARRPPWSGRRLRDERVSWATRQRSAGKSKGGHKRRRLEEGAGAVAGDERREEAEGEGVVASSSLDEAGDTF
jgi:hypothetical protein